MIYNESKAIYLQLVDRICDEILLDAYNVDDRIPSLREYAARMEVNTNTALRSYACLEQMGVLYQKRGLGYFIAPQAKALIIARRREEFFNEFMPDMLRRMYMLGIGIDEIAKLYDEYASKRKDEKQ